jgi:hypothetical protein
MWSLSSRFLHQNSLCTPSACLPCASLCYIKLLKFREAFPANATKVSTENRSTASPVLNLNSGTRRLFDQRNISYVCWIVPSSVLLWYCVFRFSRSAVSVVLSYVTNKVKNASYECCFHALCTFTSKSKNTHTAERSGAARPAACDLIRGN